jgi:predicted lipid-binding transport protein (Tim44 family)
VTQAPTTKTRQALKEETQMATPERRRGGMSLGGILVIAGVLILVFWSFWLGLIVALIGLVAFGGFVRGKWY